MAWYQIFAIVMLTLSYLGAILNSNGCGTMLLRLAITTGWVIALNAGGFFS